MTQSPDLFDSVTGFFSSPMFSAMIQFFWFFIAFLWGSLIYWTYRDSVQRGAMPLYWASVVLLFNVPGWLIYLVVRPPELLEDIRERELEIQTKEALLKQAGQVCPKCSKHVESDFVICPHCRKKLKSPCPRCKRPLSPAWPVCPYCQSIV